MIYTGSYNSCKSGNLVSISWDKGKDANFFGKTMTELAPKKEFWDTWKKNRTILTEAENNFYYIKEYYNQVLLQTDFSQLLGSEEDIILLCYEDSDMFCHRHIVAEYLNLKFGIDVPEVEIDDEYNITIKQRPEYIREMLLAIMNKI